MQTTDTANTGVWNHIIVVYFLRWSLAVWRTVYYIWFCINKLLVQTLQQRVSPAAGAMCGMLFLEGHTMCRAGWYTLKKYREDPRAYGLNQWNVEQRDQRPVLLLHGAVGSWSYLGDLACALRSANVPVFVLDLGFGLASNEIRQKIFDKIDEIRQLYPYSQGKSNCVGERSLSETSEETSTTKLIRTTVSPPSDGISLVDIVAHSNGGNVALYSAFTADCSYIDEQGCLKFRTALQANPLVGKVITVALPSDREEANWMQEINKADDLYNINAKFDALMAYKKCGLVEEHPAHVRYVDAGHIGIVYNPTTYTHILHFLRD